MAALDSASASRRCGSRRRSTLPDFVFEEQDAVIVTLETARIEAAVRPPACITWG